MRAITVRELIGQLAQLKFDAPVILSSDEEGNDFGLFSYASTDDNGNVILWPASGTVEMEV